MNQLDLDHLCFVVWGSLPLDPITACTFHPITTKKQCLILISLN